MLIADDTYYFRMRKADGSYKEQEFTATGSSSKFYIEWEDTAVSWYSINTPSNTAAQSQANVADTVYYYVVMGYDPV